MKENSLMVLCKAEADILAMVNHILISIIKMAMIMKGLLRTITGMVLENAFTIMVTYT